MCHNLFRAIAACVLAATFAAPVAAEDKAKQGQAAYNAAQKLYSTRKYAKAAEAFLAMAANFPGHTRCDAAHYMATQSAYQKRDAEIAGKAAKAHAKAYPNTAYQQLSAWYAAHAYYSHTREYDKAAPFFEQIAFRAAGNANRDSACSCAITCHIATKNFQKALEVCDKFLALFPEDKKLVIPFMLRRMDILSRLKRYDELAPLAAEMQKLAAGSMYAGQAWEKLGYARYYRQKQYAQAGKAYLKAAESPLHGNAPYCLYMAALSLESTSPPDFKGAVAIHQRNVQRFPDSTREAEVRLRLAYCHSRLKDYENALRVRAEFDKKFAKGAANSGNLWAMVQLLMRQKRGLGRAIKTCKRLIAEFPRSPETERAMYWLADRMLRGGQPKRAITVCRQLIKAFPCGGYRAKAEALMKKAAKQVM